MRPEPTESSRCFRTFRRLAVNRWPESASPPPLAQRVTRISVPYERHRERVVPLPLHTLLIRPLPLVPQPAFDVSARGATINLQRCSMTSRKGRSAFYLG